MLNLHRDKKSYARTGERWKKVLTQYFLLIIYIFGVFSLREFDGSSLFAKIRSYRVLLLLVSPHIYGGGVVSKCIAQHDTLDFFSTFYNNIACLSTPFETIIGEPDFGGDFLFNRRPYLLDLTDQFARMARMKFLGAFVFFYF